MVYPPIALNANFDKDMNLMKQKLHGPFKNI